MLRSYIWIIRIVPEQNSNGQKRSLEKVVKRIDAISQEKYKNQLDFRPIK